MKKNIFPGIEIINFDKEKIIFKIESVSDPNNISITRIDNEVYNLEIFEKYKTFYLFYDHPVHDFLDKLFMTDRDDLIKFMKERVSPERGDGFDMIVVPKNDFSEMIICNHDGDIFLAYQNKIGN